MTWTFGVLFFISSQNLTIFTIFIKLYHKIHQKSTQNENNAQIISIFWQIDNICPPIYDILLLITMKANIFNHGIYENISWELTDTGVLTISGKGNMPDWESNIYYKIAETPWYIAGCKDKIIKVVINDGITAVGNSAFDECVNLKIVLLPESVTEIHGHAFSRCYSLSEINIHQNINHIGFYAFFKCTSLTHIELPASDICISDYTFEASGIQTAIIPNGIRVLKLSAFYNTSIQELNIPKSVESISCQGDHCDNLTAINVSEDNLHYSSCNGVLFNKDKTKLISYPSGRSGAYRIPDTVETIAYNAFMYAGCMTSLFISGSVNIEHLHISKGVMLDENNELFCLTYCSHLKFIEVSEMHEEFASDDGILYNKDKTELIMFPPDKTETVFTIPESVLTIKSNSFVNNSHIRKIIIPDSVQEVEQMAFYGIPNLQEIETTNRSLMYKNGTLWDINTESVLWDKNGNTRQSYKR